MFLGLYPVTGSYKSYLFLAFLTEFVVIHLLFSSQSFGFLPYSVVVNPIFLLFSSLWFVINPILVSRADL